MRSTRSVIQGFVVLLILFGNSAQAVPPDSLTISEVMFAPFSGPNEFVEICNVGSLPVDLTGWRIRDNIEMDTLLGRGGPMVLEPLHYAVIFEIDYDTAAGIYHGLVPSDAMILYVSDGTIGNGLNNSGDAVHVISQGGDTISKYVYTATNPIGISDEKINLVGDQSSSNWANSLRSNGSPGSRNSVSLADHDLAMARMWFEPPQPTVEDTLAVNVIVRNVGAQSIASFTVFLSNDVNRNDQRDGGEEVDSATYAEGLAAGDSVDFGFTDVQPAAGWIRYLAEAVGTVPADDQTANNALLDSIWIQGPFLTDSVTFSEVMYDPTGSESSDEFIEIYNIGSSVVDLENWIVADSVGSDAIIDAGSGTMLQPGQFGVIFDATYAMDSGIYSGRIPQDALAVKIDGSTFGGSSSGLTNVSARRLFLLSAEGDTVSSYRYSTGNIEGHSDEKVNLCGSNSFENWMDGRNEGGTPGYLNSVSPVDNDLSIDSSDIRFDPVLPTRGQGYRVNVTIRNLSQQIGPVPCIIRFYGDENFNDEGEPGELVDSVVSAGVTDSLRLEFDGASDAVPGNPMRMRIEIESVGDPRMDNNQAARTVFFGQPWNTVVINELLYDPLSGGTEFVEVFNRSTSPVNLRNWTISDDASSRILVTIDHHVSPGGFRILARDSTILEQAGVQDSVTLIVPGMPSLNNDDDDVVVRDDRGAVVDSVHYFGSWGGRKGVSLERIHYDGTSQNPGNWASCLASGGSTPGTINSILTGEPRVQHSLVINEIMYSPFTGDQEYVELFNRSDAVVDLGGWSLQVGAQKVFLSVGPLIIPSGAYRVLADTRDLGSRFAVLDSLVIEPVDALPSLSNDGDVVVLRDPLGTAIDSLRYDDSWGGGPGVSLERKRPADASETHANWTSCVFVEGGTPGAVNSGLAGELQEKIRISADPNPFFVDRGERTTITVDLPVSQARMTVRMYDNQGRLIATLLNNAPSGAHREFHWDGRDRKSQMARMGIYVIYVEAIEEVSGFSGSSKATVVLGRKL